MANNLNSGVASPNTIVPTATEGINDIFKYLKTTSFHYAQTVNAQINPNQNPQNIKWKDMGKAVGKGNGGAYSEYTKKTDKKKNVTYNHPWKITAHNYQFNLPSNAHINQIRVQVYMKSDKEDKKGNGLSTFPDVGFYINPKHNVMVSKMKGVDGWHNGTYWQSTSKKVSKTWQHKEYVMDSETFYGAGYTIDMLNNTYWGVDLVFDDKCEPHTVYLGYVRVKIDYFIPTYTLVHDGKDTSSDVPRQLSGTGKVQTVKFTLEQKTIAKGGKQCFDLSLPWGTELVDATPSNGSAHWHPNKNRWTVKCDGKTKESLTVRFIDYTVDLQSIDLKNVTCDIDGSPYKANISKSFYYFSDLGSSDDYAQITTRLITKKPHKRDTCCFAVTSKASSSVDYRIEYAIGATFNYEGITEDNKVVYTLDGALSSDGVTIVDSLTTNSKIVFEVPKLDEVYDIAFSICLRPLQTGEHDFNVRIIGGNDSNNVHLKIADPYEYHFGTKTVDTDTIINIPFIEEDIGFFNHRIASELETGAYILPCRVKESDSLMTMGEANIHMYKWEQLDYIGCVPLEHLHFDPKSTYKDKLLDTHYKNKRYMGKELASDEDITLNVRLHPHQVTTIQGLIDMDKPIPINANHRCFEGDSLNHRGWAEIYGVTTTLTNPNWYKCDIDVKYLTHNLNTRFKILKGDKTFDNYPMPNLLLESVASGDALSGGDQTIDYFTVTTDGGYIYNQEEISQTWYRNDEDKIVIFVVENSAEEIAEIEAEFGSENIEIVTGETEADFEILLSEIVEQGYIIVDANIARPIVVDDTEYSNENQRNVFTLDEGQFFNIRSRQPLSNVSEVDYTWASTLISEFKENAVSKIVRLVDSTTNVPMLEYEYCDFDFTDYDGSSDNQQIECHIIARKYVKGDYTEVINEDIKIPVTVMDDEDDEENFTTMYGSTLSFSVNNNNVTIEDSGYSGKAISTSVQLEGNSYYYEIEWKNNNTDGEDNDITTYVDLVVQDSVLASQYASKYGNMLVSPFPVKDKRLIFTRNAEEGIIYYYEDDGEEFSYLIEPYYQYHNGVDLRTVDSISIFNLNYGYKTVYLENGLVSFGINRLNGQMYLRKWDNESQQYITLFTFQLQHYDDVNINNISDDRIELQASNTIISMYRGHPYVILHHDVEDINILSQFGKVWGEQVGDNPSSNPTYFDLLNTQNMLPPCVGGTKTLNDDCTRTYECGYTVDIEKDADLCKIYGLEDGQTFECPDLIDTSIVLDLDEPIYEAVFDTVLRVSGNLNDDDIIYFIIDGDVVDTPATFADGLPYIFQESRAYDISAVFIGDDTRSFAVAPTETIMVEQIEKATPPTPPTPPSPTDPCPHPKTGKYKARIETPLKFHYMDGQKMRLRLTRGGLPVCGETVEMVDFFYINTELTRKDGYTRDIFNTHSKSVPKKYKIGVRYYYMGTDDKMNVTSDFKDVEIKKADVEWKLNHLAGTVNDYFSVKLRNKQNPSVEIPNTQVTVYINGKAHTKKTNDKGNVNFKITKKGNYKYKCTFGGNKYYNKGEQSFKEKVK